MLALVFALMLRYSVVILTTGQWSGEWVHGRRPGGSILGWTEGMVEWVLGVVVRPDPKCLCGALRHRILDSAVVLDN